MDFKVWFEICIDALAYIYAYTPTCRIDGPHNKVVLATVQTEMRERGEECSLITIKSGTLTQINLSPISVHWQPIERVFAGS